MNQIDVGKFSSRSWPLLIDIPHLGKAVNILYIFWDLHTQVVLIAYQANNRDVGKVCGKTFCPKSDVTKHHKTHMGGNPINVMSMGKPSVTIQA